VRAAIALNCERYAEDVVASTAAADAIITMRRTTTALQTTMESYAREFGLSPSKIIILMALAATDGHALAQAEIARQLAVSLGSLTALVTSLQSAGLVKRTLAAEDRRVSFIALTAKGSALVKRFAPVHYRREAAALSVLSAREQRTLLQILDKLRRHLLPVPMD
jgi:MarR family 2-MHQ and catechol resistance regulon transcriptional repressor